MSYNIKLNEDQTRILSELKTFIINDKLNKFYLLTGLAGTGKSFLISYLLSFPEFKDKKIAITGCTNKAVGVLESYFLKNQSNLNISNDNQTFLTIHKLLQIKRKIGLNGEELFISSIDENNIKVRSKSIFYYDIIIVDEVSMLSRELVLQILKLQKKLKGKIIFLGDKAQLPPVKEPESHIFELGETKIPKGNLTHIMRSGDQIINFVNSIRILIDNPLHKVPFKKLSSPPLDGTPSKINVYFKDKPENNEKDWLNKYLKDVKNNVEQIILCYTNKRVDKLNQIIRQSLFDLNLQTYSNNYLKGEKIIFNNCYNLITNNNKYDSSQMVNIKTAELSNINIRQFNLFDILNPRYPISIIDTTNEIIRKKYNIHYLSNQARLVEKKCISLTQYQCHCCYSSENKDNNQSQTQSQDNHLDLHFMECGHQYCNNCFYEWNLFDRSYYSMCPLCILKIKYNNQDNQINNQKDNQMNNQKDNLEEQKQEIGLIEIKGNVELSGMINRLRKYLGNVKYKVWNLELDNKDKLLVIHEEDKEKYLENIEYIKNSLRDINMFINKNGKFKEFIDIWEKILGQLWEFYYYFFIDQFAQISYGYAITTHRSQGSTYKNVFVDLNDIIKNNIYKKEGFQCLYTAVTRASENLDILI